MTVLVTDKLPPVSQRFLNELKKKYPPITIEEIIRSGKDKDLHTKLVGRAYQQQIINYIEKNTTASDTSLDYRGNLLDRIKYVFNR